MPILIGHLLRQYQTLSQYDTIAIDLETRDENLLRLGPGWCRKDGYIIGVAIAAEIALGISQ